MEQDSLDHACKVPFGWRPAAYGGWAMTPDHPHWTYYRRFADWSAQLKDDPRMKELESRHGEYFSWSPAGAAFIVLDQFEHPMVADEVASLLGPCSTLPFIEQALRRCTDIFECLDDGRGRRYRLVSAYRRDDRYAPAPREMIW